MNRRDVLPGFPEGAHLELDPADHEEPTWEVRQPGPRRRFDRRARTILSAAAVAAVLANAGAAWAYWRFRGPETEPLPPAATSVEIALTGSSDNSRPLLPGETGDLTVTVTNQYPVPVHITSITAGAGHVMVDYAHRKAGCVDPPVEITRQSFAVSWEVPRNTIGAFPVNGALAMRADAPAACRGATFTVPVRAQAVRP
ncbi:hypothetical protein GCM10010112_06360 [Actinoplanes lobatus]|uniref:Uncharacterized protein n=1 Tax=Actinoplanes lobatus TaxID=113568 RepID=A0A7W7HAS0_9ACTN|nr:hypothetical protein [Actinoplanes lobatus]MBB4747056.1 hypothetical protein [Actinoplanes lobatus]GGN55478.1 hypothetical protein GCM10010112_06360 [Actinoplanes lobatus]GIE39376.1 hypothetical protein Alo02nite_22740 [Actinoplanes lobatus]